MSNFVLNQIADRVLEQAQDSVELLATQQAEENELATRRTGEETFLARYNVAKAYYTETAREADAIKQLELKADDVKDHLSKRIGITVKTFSNFKQVSELELEQAQYSFEHLGMQGSIDCTKAFKHLKPQAVNVILSREAERWGLGKPSQKANRHLVKHAQAHLDKLGIEGNPAEALKTAFGEIMQDPDWVAEVHTKPSEDWKKRAELAEAQLAEANAKIEELEAQLETLRAELIAEPVANSVPEGEPVAA